MHKKALSLFEVIVATILLAIIMTGLASVIVAGKRYTLHSRARMSSTELGKLFLDPLQLDVEQSDWSGTDYLSPNPLRKRTNEAGTPVTLDRSYTPSYTVTTPPSFPAESPMRKVTVTITWIE